MPEWIRPDWQAPAHVHAFSTTRSGGVSQGPWSSLNLGAACDDRPQHVIENRNRLRQFLPSEPRWLNQVHGSLTIPYSAHGGLEPQADAIFSKRAGEVCAVLTADCLPVLLADRSGSCVAAAHAGWRGLAAGVLESTVAAMDVPASKLLAWLGPAIGASRYEVGEEVRQAFIQSDNAAASAFTRHGGNWFTDLYALARQRLKNAGVIQVSGGGFCTFSEPDRFFSYRRDGQTGRMATLIWLEK
jgi:YfiH family protein